ncbi:hypothetical protein DEO72_LG7g755 [Vigna unguiculata]|uniref:Uncharacterized protein n=1 Tax=Vigna unguiculata TaxID=3917 RepID=A0A4D6MFB3_VIGUN|nr:hypothetical protein DEO72_LG7g755 [Vigna unguiculata]
MISRLSETFSPERDPGSLKPTQLLTWTRFRAQNTQVTLRPRLGECLSPERETKSLNPVLGRLGEKREPKLKTRLYNSRLGELDSLGRDLQGFDSIHAHN